MPQYHNRKRDKLKPSSVYVSKHVGIKSLIGSWYERGFKYHF